MQSSLWKLLTAAGIVGIGTVVVLEVQDRLPVRNVATSAVDEQSTGNEISVTPDAATEFDDAMVASSRSAPYDPAAFDAPGVGIGKPAPPADNARFFGVHQEAVASHEDAADEGSPFAAMMDEPPEEEEETESFVAMGDGSFEPAASQPGVVERRSPATAASFPSDTAEFTDPVPAVGPGTLTDSGTIADHSVVVPFPAEATASLPSPAAPPQAAVVASTSAKPVEKTTMMFFPNGSGAANASGKPLEHPQPVATPKLASTAAPGQLARTAKPTAPSALAPVPKEKPVQTVQRTSATVDEPPMMFVPEPVPDLQGSPRGSAGSPRITPALEMPAFDEDSIPVQPRSQNLPSGRPARTPGPANEEPEPQFFGEDNLDPTQSTPQPESAQDEDSQTLPFMDEPGLIDEPFESDPSSPIPGRTAPESEPEFPRPRFPENTPDFNDTPSPFEPDDSLPGRSTPGRSRPDRTLPDRTIPDRGEGKILPLPSADDLPTRPDRSDRDLPTRRPETGGSPGTISEVMRPQLTIQKRAPNTATVGVSHDYTIVVANEGASSAFDVIVEDELGGAADFVQSKPAADYNRKTDQLIWNFAELPAGEKKEIVVRIKPTGEGTLNGVATVRFKAQVKSATVITAPRLELEVNGPGDVKVGDEVQLTYIIRNRGTGDAANVVLRSVLPPGLRHPEGGDLEYEIENLPAGEKEEIELTVVAAEPGELILVSAEVTSSGVSAAKARTEIEVVGAQLTLERLGPERRFVGRPATYQNMVTNESKFEAINAMVVEQVPAGMRFISASNGGEYNPDNRRIRWTLPRLGAGKQSILEVQLVPEEAGQMETMVEVTENAGFRTPLKENTIVTVEDIHNVTANISRQDEPVAIGARFGFTVTIDNRGTAMAKNIELSVQVPSELKILAAGTREIPGKLFPGNVIKYNKVAEIQPNQQMTFQLTLQGETPARNARVQAFLKCDEMEEALIVSESVTVFDDRP